ncbi:MAG: tetratricopeptide repeat protein [Burkholderiales bacterium]
MAYRDVFDAPLSSGDAAAVEHYGAGLCNLITLTDDPLAQVKAALAIDPGLVMAHVLKSMLFALSSEQSLLAPARAALEAARAVSGGANQRELAHIAALDAWTSGRLHEAAARWERILVACPNDGLAMFAAHQSDFFMGQSSELRDRVARRLPELESGSALEGYYLGMHAFGLEEMGDYEQAEIDGRRAVESTPRNAWAIHAVAHVMEMTHRLDDGIDWFTSRQADWSNDSFFSIHNWWHLSLYHLERQEWDVVLKLYDDHIRGTESTVVLDMIDASALLWRLALQGVDVGDRWQPIAKVWEPLIDDAWYAFNDTHAMMAFVGAGRDDLAARLLAVMARTAQGDTDNAMMTRQVGLPVAQALSAMGQQTPQRAVELLSAVRPVAARAGGSHAQRDILLQTLIVAAERSGNRSMARALLNERLALKPHSMLSRAWMNRVAAMPAVPADRYQ